jgi:hypothetical protein
MRIIHDVETPMQVGGGGHPYSCPPGFQGYNGGRVELVICESPPENYPELPEKMFRRREVIYIDGNVEYIRRALQDALNAIDLMDKCWRRDFGEKRSMGCPDCPDVGAGIFLHAVNCPKHPNFGRIGSEGSQKRG